MSCLNLSLASSEVKILLEALIEQEKLMALACDSSEDEDEVADMGNDLIEVRLVRNKIKKYAIERYGESILNFYKSSL